MDQLLDNYMYSLINGGWLEQTLSFWRRQAIVLPIEVAHHAVLQCGYPAGARQCFPLLLVA